MPAALLVPGGLPRRLDLVAAETALFRSATVFSSVAPMVSPVAGFTEGILPRVDLGVVVVMASPPFFFSSSVHDFMLPPTPMSMRSAGTSCPA